MLTGGAMFVGDSITVGYAPFVQVSPKVQVSKGGLGSAAIRDMVQAAPVPSPLPANMVVLGGTNDIGNDARSVQSIFDALKAIWQMGKTRGMKVIALTVPPAKGFSGFASNFSHINDRRHQLNALISASTIPDQIVDLDTLIGKDEALRPEFDSGDHLHPNAQRFAATLTPVLGNFTSPISPISPLSALTPERTAQLAGAREALKLGVETAAVGGVLYGGYRLLKSWGWF